jgi:hypothetical protein
VRIPLKKTTTRITIAKPNYIVYDIVSTCVVADLITVAYIVDVGWGCSEGFPGEENKEGTYPEHHTESLEEAKYEFGPNRKLSWRGDNVTSV